MLASGHGYQIYGPFVTQLVFSSEIFSYNEHDVFGLFPYALSDSEYIVGWYGGFVLQQLHGVLIDCQNHVAFVCEVESLYFSGVYVVVELN